MNTKMEFTDNLTGAYCRLDETEIGGKTSYCIDCRTAGSDVSSKIVCAGDQYDYAWKQFRAKVSIVLNSIEEWDNM